MLYRNNVSHQTEQTNKPTAALIPNPFNTTAEATCLLSHHVYLPPPLPQDASLFSPFGLSDFHPYTYTLSVHPPVGPFTYEHSLTLTHILSFSRTIAFFYFFSYEYVI